MAYEMAYERQGPDGERPVEVSIYQRICIAPGYDRDFLNRITFTANGRLRLMVS